MGMSLPSLRERNRTEVRARLVRAALDLFAAEGFDSVSVERICEEAAVSRATFFNYFAQKEEILVEIGRQRLERFEQFVTAQEAWDEKPSIEGLVELFLEFGRANEEAMHMGKHVILRTLTSPTTGSQIQALMAAFRERVAGYLGRLGDKRAKATAENAVAIYFWSTIEFAMLPNPPEGWLVETLRRRLRSLLGSLRRTQR